MGGNITRIKIERTKKGRAKSMNYIVTSNKFGNKEYCEVTYKKLILLRLKIFIKTRILRI